VGVIVRVSVHVGIGLPRSLEMLDCIRYIGWEYRDAMIGTVRIDSQQQFYELNWWKKGEIGSFQVDGFVVGIYRWLHHRGWKACHERQVAHGGTR